MGFLGPFFFGGGGFLFVCFGFFFYSFYSYIVEKYVTLYTIKPIRFTLAMLRCGLLPLRIEIGRAEGNQLRTEYVTYVHVCVS